MLSTKKNYNFSFYCLLNHGVIALVCSNRKTINNVIFY